MFRHILLPIVVLVGWLPLGPAVAQQEQFARWEKAITAFEAKDRQQPPPQEGILFIGSSSIRGWKLKQHFSDLPVINRGFGGSQIADSTHFADRLLFPHKPQTVVLYAGDNDIAGGKTVETVVQDYQRFVEKVHGKLPETRIIFVAIKPSIKRWKLVGSMRRVNRRIEQIAVEDERLMFLDIDRPMIGPDGEPRADLFIKDGLHLNEKGYQLWAALLRPLIDPLTNWPQFRGPGGDGHSAATGVAVTWSEQEHVTWKTEIHGRGWSSPVVWGKQIWLTTATADGKEQSVICVDKETGEILHDRLLLRNEEPRFCHATNSYASPTPVIEEGRVYIHFGSYGTTCLDTKTGETIWQRRDLPCDHWRGPGSSPILFDGMLIAHYDGYDRQYVVALEKHTGKTIWKRDRNIDYQTDNGDLKKAYCTPIVIEVNGRKQLISPAAKATLAYDPYTGEELWKIRYDQHSATARPVYGHGLVFVNTGFGKSELHAVRPTGQGDVTETHVDWRVVKNVPSMPSQLLIDEAIYMVNKGVVTCLAAKTGEEIWAKRIGGTYAASPLYVDGRVYFFSREGKTTVIAPAAEYQELASNQLDSGFMSSPAVTGSSLILRTTTHLYRID